MSGGPCSPPTARHAQLLALAGELRPELHRYCARLMGSVIEGEDVVQDTFARAFVALDELQDAPPLRAWLFRIAHNRAVDLLRSRAIRAAEPIEAAHEIRYVLTDAGLVDELRLIVYPLIAGEGKALFATTERRHGLEMRKVHQLQGGRVSLIYGTG